MSVIVTDLGEVEMLRWTLKEVPAEYESLNFHLFQNDYHPNRISPIGAFEEADFDGYSAAELLREEWANPVTIGGIAFVFYGTEALQFVPASGEQDIFGYYVTGSDDLVVLWAERFPAVIEVNPIQPLLWQPFMRLRSEFQPDPP